MTTDYTMYTFVGVEKLNIGGLTVRMTNPHINIREVKMANIILRKFVSVNVPAPTFAQIKIWLKENGYEHTGSEIPYYEYPKMSYWTKRWERKGKKLIRSVSFPCVSRHKKFPQLMGQFIAECAMIEGMSTDELYNIIVEL